MLDINETISILLSVVGENRGADDESPDVIRLVTTGRLSRPAADEYVLAYTETDPDDGRSQDITMTMSPHRITMTRNGPYETTMVFEKDKRFDGWYETPWGSMSMGIFPVKVQFAISESEGMAELEYQVDLQGAFSGMHHLKLRFAPND